MNGWFASNSDYLIFLALIAGLWIGLGGWLHRTGRLGSLPKITWVILVVVAGGGWWLVDRAGAGAQQAIRRQVEVLLPYYAQEMQQIGHARLPDTPPPNDPLYLKLIAAEIDWLKLNPAISDIYTFRRRADGAVFLVVDSETDYDHNGRIEGEREQRTVPGELYNGMTPALERAFRGEIIFDDDVVVDRWGQWVSAFAPLRDPAGNVEAVLGVDFDATEWQNRAHQARLSVLWGLGGSLLLLSGPAVLIAVLRHDLRRRRVVEQQLREQLDLRRIIFDHAPGGVVLADLNHRFVEVNEACCRMLGYRREELLEMTMLQITLPEDLDKTRAKTKRAFEGKSNLDPLEQRYIRKDGSLMHASVQLSLVRNAQGAPQFLVGQLTDLTARRQVEAQLQYRQKQLSTVLSHAPLVLFAIDHQGIITLAEGAGTAAIGRLPGEAVGHSVFDRYAARPDMLEDVRRALAGEIVTSQHEVGPATFEARLMPLRDPEGRVTGLIGVAINITDRIVAAREREKMEHKLLEVQKLESLGILAGGVAHDFNNLLTAIVGNAGLARIALGQDSPAVANLQQIEQASQLAAGLCQQLLAYAGRSRHDPQPLDLGALVRETTDLLRLSTGTNAQLKLNLAPALPAVLADPAQLRQVLLNLAQNAAEAIGAREGRIEITTRLITVDAAWLADCSTGRDLPPGTYACLEVADNGPGMDPEARGRVFDPFYSTKGSGRGLGLAATLGIMRSHGGALRLVSEPGQGATFTLVFPANSRPAAPAPTPTPPARNWRGTGTVLVVDDEDAVRITAAQMIAFFGFTVKQVASGQEAVDYLRARGSRCELVLLDLTMPGMDGYATFTAIRQLYPDQRIVVFSGYSAQDAKQRFAGQNLNGFLQKPFSADSLREILRDATAG